MLLDPVPKHVAGRIGTQDGERVPRRSFSTRRDGNTRMQFINTGVSTALREGVITIQIQEQDLRIWIKIE